MDRRIRDHHIPYLMLLILKAKRGLTDREKPTGEPLAHFNLQHKVFATPGALQAPQKDSGDQVSPAHGHVSRRVYPRRSWSIGRPLNLEETRRRRYAHSLGIGA